MSVRQHYQTAHRYAKQVGGRDPHQQGGQRSGDQTADQQGDGKSPVNPRRADANQKAQAGCDANHELGRIDGADNLTRL